MARKTAAESLSRRVTTQKARMYIITFFLLLLLRRATFRAVAVAKATSPYDFPVPLVNGTHLDRCRVLVCTLRNTIARFINTRGRS